MAPRDANFVTFDQSRNFLFVKAPIRGITSRIATKSDITARGWRSTICLTGSLSTACSVKIAEAMSNVMLMVSWHAGPRCGTHGPGMTLVTLAAKFVCNRFRCWYAGDFVKVARTRGSHCAPRRARGGSRRIAIRMRSARGLPEPLDTAKAETFDERSGARPSARIGATLSTHRASRHDLQSDNKRRAP